MKIIFDHNVPNPNRPNVYVKLEGKKPKFMFEKEEGYPVCRRSKYSFIYQENMYDLKHNITKEWK